MTTDLFDIIIKHCKAVPRIINRQVENHHCDQPDDAKKWVIDTYQAVLNHLPKDFWNRIDLNSPTSCSQLFPKTVDKSTAIIQLIVWSCSKTSVANEIVQCVSYGKQHWNIIDGVVPIDWIRAFVSSISVSVHHSVKKYAKSKKLKSPKESPVKLAHIEMCCLPSAVTNSASMFFLITRYYTMQLILWYIGDIRSSSKNKDKILHPKITQLEVSVTLESSQFIEVSIVTWYRNIIIIPFFRQLLNLKLVKDILKLIKIVVRGKRYNKGQWSSFLDLEIQPKVKLALVSWSIECPNNVARQYQFIVLLCLGYGMTKLQLSSAPSYGQKWIMKIISMVNGPGRLTCIDVVKKFMAQEPPFFPIDFVKDVVNFNNPLVFRIPVDKTWKTHYSSHVLALQPLDPVILDIDNPPNVVRKENSQKKKSKQVTWQN